MTFIAHARGTYDRRDVGLNRGRLGSATHEVETGDLVIAILVIPILPEFTRD